MPGLLERPRKAVQEAIAKTEHDLVNGRFDTLVEAKALVARRKGMIEALEIVEKHLKTDDMEDS